jgi:hypothetical protein
MANGEQALCLLSPPLKKWIGGFAVVFALAIREKSKSPSAHLAFNSRMASQKGEMKRELLGNFT